MLQKDIKSFSSGRYSRGIGVENQDRGFCVVAQNSCLFGGQGGPASCNHMLNAMLHCPHLVEITLHKNDLIFSADSIFCLIHAEKRFTLLVKKRFRRIEVFGLILLGNGASAKTSDVSVKILDRENNPAAKTVINVRAIFFLDDQPGLHELFLGDGTFLLDMIEQASPGWGRPAYPVAIQNFRIKMTGV